MATTMDKVKQVNEILLKGEPHNITEETRGSQTYTGYAPQYIIDAMNEVFDLGGWGFEEISNELVDVPAKSGVQVRAIAQVRVWIKGVEFRPTAYGQANVTMGDAGDAKKGAQTDALKKALSYFSIGNRAYQGLLPTKQQAKASQQNRVVQRPPQKTEAVPAVQPANVKQADNPQKPAEEKPIIVATNKPTSDKQPQVLDDAIKQRLNKVYIRAKTMNLFTPHDMKSFFKFVSEVVGVQIVAPQQLASSHLDALDKHIGSLKAVA